MVKRIDLEARVVKFSPFAMSDSLEDGSWASYAGTTLVVLAPPGLLNTELTIFHNQPPDDQSPWRKVGRRIRFALRADRLEGRGQIFDGAVRDLELVEEASPGNEGAPP